MKKVLILMSTVVAVSFFQVFAHGTVTAAYIDAVGNTVYVDTGGGIKASMAQINLEKQGNAMDVVGKAESTDLTGIDNRSALVAFSVDEFLPAP